MINSNHRYRGGERVQSEFQMRAKDWMIERLLITSPFLLLSTVSVFYEFASFILNDSYYFHTLQFFMLNITGVLLSYFFGTKLSNKYVLAANDQNERMLNDEYVRGSKIVDVKDFNMEQTAAAYDAKIPSPNEIIRMQLQDNKALEIAFGASFQMVGFFGTTGSGKSNGMMQYYSNVKDKKRIILDMDGSFYKKFFQEGDILFCPFSADSVKWNIFDDIKTIFDAANIAKSLVPEDPSAGQNSFFDSGARIVTEAVLSYLAKQRDSNNQLLWEYITDFELIKQIKDVDSDAKRLLDYFTNEKQKLTADVHSTIISKTAVRSLEFLQRITPEHSKSNKRLISDFTDDNVNDSEQPFSFREWLRDDSKNNALFLVVDETIQEYALPLYRVVIELIAAELLSLPQKEGRSVFFFLDEFPAMKKMEKIIALLTRARKQGGAIIHGAQNYAQYESVYGKEEAKTIMSNTNTLFVFRHPDGDYFSERFGKQEIWEYSESTSMRTTDVNEGFTGTKQKKEKVLVLSSEIARLENLESFVKSIAQDITKVRFEYTVPADKNRFVLDNSIYLRR